MDLTIVGGGLTGLTAAIEAAEGGWQVTLHEARSTLGGRAATLEGPYRANRGPHALYADGPLWAWLERRGLNPPTVSPSGETLFRVDGTLQSLPAAVGHAIAGLPSTAPVGESFRTWLAHHIDDGRTVEAIIGLMFIVTYNHDPGELSAAFVHERLVRGGSHVRYVQGGWGRLIDSLVGRAEELGVALRTRGRVQAVPDGPTIVATSMTAARILTQESGLESTGSRVALVDLGLRSSAPITWFRVYDLDHRIYAARYSEVDPSLAPPRHHLVQIAAALAPGEAFSAAVARVYDLLDATSQGWTDHVDWKRSYEVSDETGAVDLPGSTWANRPAVMRTPTLAIATDQSAAPGLLAEVAHNAARSALTTLGQSASPSTHAPQPAEREAAAHPDPPDTQRAR